MLPFFILIRFQNLVMIVLTQCVLKYCLVNPLLEKKGLSGFMDDALFFLFTMSCALIAAGGYIINDYFDRKTDAINKPERVIVGRSIHRRTAMIAHVAVTCSGLVLGSYVAYRVDSPFLFVWHVLAAAMLWLYSTYFKRMLLGGNVVIALLAGLVPLLTALFEPVLLRNIGLMALSEEGYCEYFFLWVFVYSFFAALTTLFREIIKDMEDLAGDKATGHHTLPIEMGLKKSNFITIILIWLTVASLGFIQLFQFRAGDMLSFFYFLFLLDAPLIVLTYKIASAGQKRDYSTAARMSKLVMMAGIFYGVVLYYF